ncbi:hypothetical protein GCM10027072_60670 [Streptomyces bullii]
MLVVVSWSFTESIDDGIEPTSGPRPKPSVSASVSSPACAVPTPTPSADPEGDILAHRDADPDLEPAVVTAVVCKVDD